MPDKKVTIGIETTAKTQGADEIRKRLEEIQREANETGQSFDALARKEFGNLDAVFDEFNAELAKARKQLDELSKQGVDIGLAASGLDKLQDELTRLRADVRVDVQADDARKEVAAIAGDLDIKAKVDDSEIDETVRKVDRLESDTALVDVDVSDGDLDDTKRKVEGLSDTAEVNVATNDASVDEAAKKVARLDQDSVTVDVDADLAELDEANRQLGNLKDKNVRVDVETGELDEATRKAEALNDPATVKVSADDSALEDVERRVGRLDKDSITVDVDADLAELDEANRKLGNLKDKDVAVRVSDGELDDATKKAEALSKPVDVQVATNDASLDEAAKKLERIDHDSVTVDIDADLEELDEASRKLGNLKDKAVRVEVSDGDLDEAAKKAEQLEGTATLKVSAEDSDLEDVERRIGRIDQDTVTVDVDADLAELDEAGRKLGELKDKQVRVDVSDGDLDETVRKIDRLESDVDVNVSTKDSDVDETARKLQALDRDPVQVGVDADLAEIDEAERKLAKIRDKNIAIEVDGGDVDETLKKAEALDQTATVRVDTNDASLDEAGQKLARMDQDTVTVDVDADLQELEEANRKLSGLQDKDVTVNARIAGATRDLADLGNRLDRLKSKADAALALDADDRELRELGEQLLALERQLGRVQKGSKAFEVIQRNVRATRAEIQRTAQAKGFTNLNSDTVKTGKLVDGLRAQFSQLKKTIASADPGSDTFRASQKSIASLRNAISGLESSADEGTRGLASLAGAAGRIPAPIAAATAGVLSLTAALGAFRSGIAKASQAQDLQVQLQILLGSADEAEKRIAELRDFAATTPFQLPQLTEASRILETITQGALSTGEGLRLVGDLAAGTGEDFANLAVHIGRVYDGLQNNTAVGESLLRLQELGIITAETRREIEELQKANKQGDEVWEVAARDFSRFSGAMEARSKTLSGVWSTLKDNFNQLLATIGKPALVPLTEALRLAIPVVQTATKAVSGLFRWFGLLGPAAKDAGDSIATAYSDIGQAAEKAGAIATKAARGQAKGFEEADRQLGNYLSRLKQVTDANRELRDATFDRKIAEIEADETLTEEEKRTAVAKLESQRRLENHQAEQDALVKQVELANERIQQLEAQRNSKKRSLDKAEDEQLKVDEAIAVREGLASLVDQTNAQIADLQAQLAAAREGLFPERVKLLEEGIAVEESIREKAEGQLDALEQEADAGQLKEAAAKAAATVNTLRVQLSGYADAIAEAQKEATKVAESSSEQARRNARLFREVERTRQAEFRTETNQRRREAETGQAETTLKESETALKDLDAQLANAIAGLSEIAKAARPETPKPATDTKALDALGDIEVDPSSGQFAKQLERLGNALKDGADKEELEQVEKLLEIQARNPLAKRLLEAVGKLLDDRTDTTRRLAEVESKLAGVRQESRGDATRIEAERDRGVGQTIARAERVETVARESGDTRLADRVKEATDALRDGATEAELGRLVDVIKTTNTAISDAMREAVQFALTSANTTQALVAETNARFAALSAKVKNLEGQVKGNRK